MKLCAVVAVILGISVATVIGGPIYDTGDRAAAFIEPMYDTGDRAAVFEANLNAHVVARRSVEDNQNEGIKMDAMADVSELSDDVLNRVLKTLKLPKGTNDTAVPEAVEATTAAAEVPKVKRLVKDNRRMRRNQVNNLKALSPFVANGKNLQNIDDASNKDVRQYRQARTTGDYEFDYYGEEEQYY